MICRDRINGIIVDVMPTGENALGFTNPWYEKGYVATVQYELEKGCVIKISHPVYFLASKIAAFNDRRGGDGRRSSDFEDLVFVLNNRTRIWQELSEAKGEVASLLKKESGKWLEIPYIEEWISAHIERNEQRRIRMITGEMESFVTR
jgi:hypothetical protein